MGDNQMVKSAPHTLSERMRLPIDGPLMGPLMTIGEWTVNAWANEVEALEEELDALKPAPITPVDKLKQGYERAGLSSALVVNNKYGKHSAFGYMGREW